MGSRNLNVGVKKTRRAVGRKRWLAVGAAPAVVLFAGTASRGAFIGATTAADVPISNPLSVFDASNSGNTYSLEPGTNFIPAGFDARDLFGGSFGTFGPEQNDVLFADGQPIGTVEAVDVTLAAPVSLSSFNLFLEDDGSSGDRSAREFLLFAGGQLIDDVPLLDTTGTQSYTGVYGSNYIDIGDTFSGLPASADYTLEFVQNHDAGGSSGIRALEFEASGSTATAVPEPKAAAALALGCLALSQRRRRRVPVPV